MKNLILYLFLLTNCISYCQDRKIDLEQLESKVFSLINDYRVSLRVTQLEKDVILQKAAKDHAICIAKKQSLTHEQSDPNKKLPKDRVYFYKGNDFVLVGENLLFTGIKDKIYTETDLDALALKIFNLWKNSPNHLKIMSNKKFFYTGFGFHLDWTNKKIFVAQVFGTK